MTIEEKIKAITESEDIGDIPLAALPTVRNERFYFVSYSQKDYKEVKRKAKEKCTQGNPKIVSVKTVDGHLRFTYKDVITGEYEEI